MTMTFSTLTTESWNVMYNHLQTGTYAISTNNIFSAYNDELVKDRGFPIVIIRPALLSIKNIDMKGIIKRVKVSYQIDVYHKTVESLKTLVDLIITKITTGYSVFATNGLRKPKNDDWFTTIDYDAWTEGKFRVHMYSIGVNFKYTG